MFVRDKSRLTKDSIEGCAIIEGDAMNYSSIKNAVSGQHIVYVNLAGNLEAMTKNIVKAMQETGAKRIIAISSIGIYETPLRSVLVPYRKLADVIEDSGLDYTILRPDWFTNSNEISYVITRKGEPENGAAISRRSIVAFISTIVENPGLYKKGNLGISKPLFQVKSFVMQQKTNNRIWKTLKSIKSISLRYIDHCGICHSDLYQNILLNLKYTGNT